MYSGGVWNNLATWMANLKKKQAQTDTQTAQAAQPTYQAAPDQMTVAAKMLPAPAKLADLTKNPLYQQQADITKLPQYTAATTKTVLDPEYYKNKWTAAEGDINKSYMKKGGYYDRMMEGLNERGLGTSGEANFQTREVGSNLASELAKAYQGIETERMGQQAGLDEAYAGRMGGMLGTQNTNLANLLGLTSGRETTQQGMDWATSQGKAGLASQLADAYNQLVSGDYDRAAGTAQAEYGAQGDILDRILGIAGQGQFEDSGYDDEMNSILSGLGYPVNQEAARKKKEEDQYYRDRQNALTGSFWPSPR